MAYKQRWNELFNSLDGNKSGDLTIEDAKIGLANFVKASGIKEGTPQYQLASDAYDAFYRDLIKEIDSDGDGKVSKPEYDQTVEKIVSGGKANIPQWWKSSVATLFQSIDKNRNGELSFDEFREYAKNTSPNSSDADIQAAFEWAKKVTGKSVIDNGAFMDLVWIWGSSPDVHPELAIIFSYWK